MKLFLLFTFYIIILAGATAQVAINTDGSTPHNSAILDIKSSSKGLLVPRVSLSSETDVATIPSPQTSLLVFNTNSTLIDGAGYYYWTGSRWNKLATLSNVTNVSWGMNGNTGVGDTNFIGTINNKPLVFKTNNILSGKIDPGPNNVFLGQSSGLVTTGTNNTFLGHIAGAGNLSGANNTFAGHSAGNLNTIGQENVFLGQDAGKNNLSGSSNVFVGEDAGIENTIGDDNTFIGNGAGRLNNRGSKNIAIGFDALRNLSGADRNYYIAIGEKAGYNEASQNSVAGVSGIYIGHAASYNGGLGIAIGDSTCFNNSERFTTAIGHNALNKNSTGTGNTVVGFNALTNNTDGQWNTAMGYKVMVRNITGKSNSAFGSNALGSNDYGDYNAAFGSSALGANTYGDYNTAFGSAALIVNGGNNNSAVGYQALSTNISGSNNTAVGAVADVSYTDLHNTTTIGAGSSVSTSNTMVFGNEDVTRWAFGLNTTNAQHALEVGDSFGNGNGAYLTQGGNWTNTCDVTKKEDFTALDENDLLQKISKLSVQRWKYKGTNEYHIGPTAQDFYKAFGLGTDDKGISTVDPAGIALAAIQVLIKENEALKNENDSLKKRMEAIEQMIREKLK